MAGGQLNLFIKTGGGLDLAHGLYVVCQGLVKDSTFRDLPGSRGDLLGHSLGHPVANVLRDLPKVNDVS